MHKKVAVILSGCGVYDGAEIHESVITLLRLSQRGAEAQCFAPNIAQHHVVNHLTGEEMPESRNVWSSPRVSPAAKSRTCAKPAPRTTTR